MAIVYENQCVDCGLPCLGSACRNRNVPVLYCDKCNDDCDNLYHYNGEQWCIECIKEDLGEVEVEE